MVDNEGNTLYHTAVKRGKLEFLEKLSAYPLDINKKNNEGLSPLQKAVMIAKNVEVINFLLSKGADKNALTDLGETVYELAKENEALKGINVEFLNSNLDEKEILNNCFSSCSGFAYSLICTTDNV